MTTIEPMLYERSEITFTVNSSALTHQDWQGEEHLVFPIQAVRSQVLNDRYLPLDEIEKSLNAWAGRPLVVNHPESPVSVNQPDLLAKQFAGWFFDIKMNGDRMQGDGWFNADRAKKLGGDHQKLLDRLLAGDVIEVSTAYWHRSDPTPGVHKGVAYNSVDRDLIPDHLALLPDSVGACSVADGCGGPRMNEADVLNNEEQSEMQNNENQNDSQVVGNAEDPTNPIAEEPLADAEPTTGAGSDAPAEPGTTHAREGEDPVIDSEDGDDPVLPPAVAELLDLVSDLGGVARLRDVLAELSTNSQRESSELVDAILASNNRLDREMLEGLPLATLRALAPAATPAENSYRPGFSGNNAGGQATWVPFTFTAAE